MCHQATAALQPKPGFQQSCTASFFVRALAPPTQPALNTSTLLPGTGKNIFILLMHEEGQIPIRFSLTPTEKHLPLNQT